MFKTLARLSGSTVAALALALGSQAAHATTTYTFDASSVAGFGGGTYGSVTLTQDGANVGVSVELRGDLDFVVTGGPHSILAFNVAGAAPSDATGVAFSGGSNGTLGVIANGAATSYGTFALVIDCVAHCVAGNPGALRDPLQFTVLNATEADFAHLNGSGYFFAADVICGATSTIGGCSGRTGSIAVKGPGTSRTNVPEPGTLALLGLGLIGLGILRRRKR